MKIEIKSVVRSDLNFIASHPDVKKNVMTFSSNAHYLGAYLGGLLIGCVGWIEFKNYIKLKAGFVLPEYRGNGYYSILCQERFRIIRPLQKPMYANCTASALPYHIKSGAIIIKEYKHPSYKIKYDNE